METIKFKIGQPKGESLIFNLKMISVNDETKFLERFTNIADGDDKAGKEYEIYVDALAAWVAETPLSVNGDGKEKPVGKGEASEAVKAYFAERTPAKEWIADYAIRAFRSQLQPEVSFL